MSHAFHRISLRSFIILTVILVVGISNAIVTRLLVVHSERSQIEDFIHLHAANVKSLAPTLALTVWEFNVQRANSTLSGLDDEETFLFAGLVADQMQFAVQGDQAAFDQARETVQDFSWKPLYSGQYRISGNMLTIHFPIVIEQSNRKVGHLLAGFSLDTMFAENRMVASQIIIIALAGMAIVLIGLALFAVFVSRWLERVTRSITGIAAGELSENTDSRTPIAEFQDIDAALRQLRRDAFELIELQSKSRADERIRHMAMHDPLTNLANRRALEALKEPLVQDANADENWLEVLHIDLDGFKQVNDTDGHAAGDEILQIAARRLQSIKTDATHIFRVGGDEFVILRIHPTAENLKRKPLALAKKLVAALSEPYPFGQQTLTVGASIGVVTLPQSQADLDRALMDADLAMYAAKAAGRRRCILFSPALRDARIQKMQRISDLKQALNKGELVPFYQPKVDSETHVLSGAEALIRWQHPTDGLLAPDQFLDIAEECNLLDKIDQIVFQTVCEDIRRWRALGFETLRISVNLSERRFADPNLIKELKSTDFEPGTISFELLETIYLDDVSDAVLERIDEIRGLGITIELDDFGSGHASMVSLLKIGPDRLKLDRRFVHQLKRQGQSHQLVSQIVNIGRSLSMPVIAEGVETLEQAKILADLGCDMLQGYYFGTPCPSAQFEKEHLNHVQTDADGTRTPDSAHAPRRISQGP